ncbi:MAG: hypothetical protein Q9223_003452 [Gallowayella weberi]
MAATESTEAKELSLVGKVELRIAMTDSDPKLENILNTYLPPLLLKLASDHITVRNKVISICQHINTRVKAPNIKLPVTALLKQYKENRNALVRHFDILYIQQGLSRLSIPERLQLLPMLVQGIQKNFEESARHTASLFNMLLKLLHSVTFPPRGSAEDTTLRHTLGFSEDIEDAPFIASWIGRLILFSPNLPSKRLPGLTTEECNFLQLYDKGDTWLPGIAGGMNIVETKVAAVKFLASGAFSDTERFLPALIATSDINTRVSALGEDMMKRAVSAVSLEDAAVLEQLFRLYLGTRGTDGSLPARVPLQVKVLGLLCRSKRATSFTARNIQIIKEGLTSNTSGHSVELSHAMPANPRQGEISFSPSAVQGLEASKLRTQIFAYTNWLARMSDPTHNNVVAPSTVTQLRDYIESQGWPIFYEDMSQQRNQETNLRSLGYESIGVLARASAEALILDEDLDLLRWLFDSLAADTAGREVVLSIEMALSSILGAFGGYLKPEFERSLESLLLHNMQRQSGELLEQFFGENSVWSTEPSQGGALTMANAYGSAVTLCFNILFHESLSSGALVIDSEWERQLTTLVTNDESSRNRVRHYLHAMAQDPERESTLGTLFTAALNGIVASAGSNVATCSTCLLQLCSSSSDISVGSIVPSVFKLQNSVLSNDKAVREASSRLFGILGSHQDCPRSELEKILRAFEGICNGWQEAVGSDYLQIHGAVLATAYYWSRRAFRASLALATEDESRVQAVVALCLEILSTSKDKTLLDAATVSIAQLSVSGILSPKSLVQSHRAATVVKRLADNAGKGNENAVKALGSFGMQCDEDFTEDSLFHQVFTALFKLHEVREVTLQFSVGEAFSNTAAGWASKALDATLDVDCRPPSSPSRNVSLSWILGEILGNCKTTKPALRQASVIWLLCLVQFCGHLPAIQEKLRDCQTAFKGFLADRESLNQETASRGLSIVYEKGDRELKDDLVRDLVNSFTGSSVNLSGSISGETQLFEPGALPTGEGSITTYKDIMSLAAEVGNPSLVYKFMSLAANNAIWSSRAAFGRFGLSNIFSDSSVDGYLAQNPKLYPALFRYRFDPNTNVRSSMNEIWAALVPEPTVTIDKHFDTIMDDLLKNILGKEWRTRQACCGAVADLVQSRPSAKYEKYIGEIWTLTFKVGLCIRSLQRHLTTM